MSKKNRYKQLIEAIFFSGYSKGKTQFDFHRKDIERHAESLGIQLSKNLGDVIYSFRYRTPLPDAINKTCPAGKEWLILGAGQSQYRFSLTNIVELAPNESLGKIKLPDATPGIISSYALGDEQALLAKLRYNRLLDIFSRVTCYSLQNHLRTTVSDIGQLETDEVYVGLDRSGTHYVFPLQAKGGADKLSVVQVKQDLAMCSYKFGGLICRPVGAQFLSDDAIALFEFSDTDEGIRVIAEKHYKLVPPEDITEQDLQNYRRLHPES
ncbi:MAG: endonuclease [Planctomycetes bacterium]|nr:endonuclease [Planctomycetota bacterium]